MSYINISIDTRNKEKQLVDHILHISRQREARRRVRERIERQFFGLWRVKFGRRRQTRNLKRKLTEKWKEVDLEVKILTHELQNESSSEEEMYSISAKRLEDYFRTFKF